MKRNLLLPGLLILSLSFIGCGSPEKTQRSLERQQDKLEESSGKKLQKTTTALDSIELHKVASQPGGISVVGPLKFSPSQVKGYVTGSKIRKTYDTGRLRTETSHIEMASRFGYVTASAEVETADDQELGKIPTYYVDLNRGNLVPDIQRFSISELDDVKVEDPSSSMVSRIEADLFIPFPSLGSGQAHAVLEIEYAPLTREGNGFIDDGSGFITPSTLRQSNEMRSILGGNEFYLKVNNKGGNIEVIDIAFENCPWGRECP